MFLYKKALFKERRVYFLARRCTMPNVIKCLVYIGIAAFLHQLPRFFDRQYVPHLTVWRGHFEEVCHVRT